MKLQGKVIIVTGAGSGIGRSVALAFAREGADVVVNDLDGDAAKETVAEIHGAGGTATPCVRAVGDEEAAAALVRAAVDEHGDLDVLVNCAGLLRDRMIHNMTMRDWDDVLRVHLTGTFCNCREAIRYWRPLAKQEAAEATQASTRRKRKIINVTSMSGLRGNIGQANYVAAKAGIAGLTKGLAKEVGRFGIAVNAVAPLARTAMTEVVDGGLQFPEGPEREAYLQARLARSALRWIGVPEDVAPAFVFLASSDSDYISGQIINSDGGSNI